jgi:ABC-type Zn uptake system ZnuABC Zn-binding protein ZnuA
MLAKTLPRFLIALALASAAVAEVRVVTTTPTLAAVAREVGGARVRVESLCRPDQDPHALVAKPSDMLALRRADLFVQVGLDLELGWVPLLLQGARNRRVQPGAAGFVDASEGLVPLEVPAVVSRAEGDVHPHGNPHYWLDPANGELIARNVAAGLERVDPAGAAAYRAALEDFVERLRAAIPRWQDELASVREVEVVSYHRSWPYLEHRLGPRFIAELEPKPGIPPAPRHLAELQELVAARGVRAIVRAPHEPSSAVKRLAQRSGARELVLPTEPGAPGVGPGWFDLFDAIVEALATELAARAGPR